MKIGSKKKFNELDIKAVNNIKTLAIDMIDEAKSGHPGIVLSAAPIIYTIYAKHLRFNPQDPKWLNRDRFVMSAGHGSSLLYATLFMFGYDLSIDDLKSFRKLNSKTPGHPEVNLACGIEASTGPLGSGIATSIGMAIASKFLKNRYTYQNKSLIDNYIYVLVGDGDLMEGVSYEACSIAGNLGLGNLIVLYDSNRMSLDRDTKETFKEKIIDRFKAMNWDTHLVINGNNLLDIDKAIEKAKKVKDKPSLIEIRTILGNGSKLANTNKVHGTPLDKEDIKSLKKSLDMRDVAFTVSSDAYKYLQEQTVLKNKTYYDNWYKEYNKIKTKIKPRYKEEIEKLINNNLEVDLSNISIDPIEEETLRDISSRFLNNFITDDVLFLGGSADVATSTRTYLEKMGDFTKNNPKGRNILFGVREHAMASICNGITLSGIRTYASTFLAFSDYLKPAIRMSALMNLPVIYIFTHDDITIGEDGPTHQPIEQLISLRSIPNVDVYRPADLNEVIGSYKNALKKLDGPSIIILSKEKVKVLENTNISKVEKGGYIVKDYEKIMGIIIATGKELPLALELSDNLANKNIFTRVVSMPSLEVFNRQKSEYKESILPLTSKKIVIEFSSSYSWYKFVYNDKYLFNVNDFGKSANKEDILTYFNLNKEQIENRLEELLK